MELLKERKTLFPPWTQSIKDEREPGAAEGHQEEPEYKASTAISRILCRE